MASGIYQRFQANILKGNIDLENDVLIAILLDENHSFNAAHNNLTNVVANELENAGGYTPQDKEVTNGAVTQAASTKFDADDIIWTDATFTAYNMVIYDETASNDLICSYDFGGAKTVTDGTFMIQFHVDGIILVEASA